MNSVPCLNCGKTFKAERKTAKFCSDVCRSSYAKKLAKKTGTKIAVENTPPKKEVKEKPKTDVKTKGNSLAELLGLSSEKNTRFQQEQLKTKLGLK